ncbi:MAG: tRNA pseudouridine(38-40) synthase TruA [Ureaplasma sp.]|nr:tRNA pseudouridine(38-40) synthase TruA [Ureaplasma sp.]MDE7221814.1 tRNA pseudouridine(38-40) synthase TruA [Ureaplasma sp.]
MNYKISISYRGTNYHGFAKQNNVPTIEQTLIDVFKELFNINVKIFGSGRTDRFVHAYEQIISINHPNLNLESNSLKNALNSKLPSDIKVNHVEIVDSNFHARFFAKNKTYIYKLNFDSNFDVFNQDLIYQYNKPIDFKKLNIFIEKIIGEHDFLSFSTSEIKDTIRTINSFEYVVENNLLIFSINGNGFLRNMVRMIIGCFLNYNEDIIGLKEIDDYFSNPKKGSVIRKEKGCGLYLYKVNY